MNDGHQERTEVYKAEERAYQFVAGDPSVSTMSNAVMFSIYFIYILHL